MNLRLLFGAALLLTACDQSSVAPPARQNLAIDLVHLKPGQTPPARDGVCWAKDTTPAVIETVTEQILISEEIRDATGAVTTPASYQTKTHQRMVQDTEEVWFPTPCSADMTVNFMATLQRALKARGLYMAPVTGTMNATTAEAIRRFQEPRGLDSATLSTAAARELGIISTDINTL